MAEMAKPLTVSEAQRAIYIDFEGTAVDPPSLLGVAWFDDDKARFVQYVVEEDLTPKWVVSVVGLWSRVSQGSVL